MPDTCATLVGLGAIGCPLALLLAPVPEVVRLTLIDFDRFTAGNRALGLERADVGQYKARAVASKVRRIRRDLKVEAVVARAEHVPFGDLRGMVICCGDNRPVRSTCSEAAFRGGADALIDAGVRRDHLLARATIYFPQIPGAACHLCGWGKADWDAYAASYTCQGSVGVPATGSPMYLTALAAALAAQLCCDYLRGDAKPQADARQLVYSAEVHRAWETAIRRNPACHFDHGQWIVTRVGINPARYTLGEALEELGGPLAVPGLAFARRLR
ncbi:MAG: ThiF family adenylyltransferase, partial [Bryobacteraceae bacterium]